MEHRIRAAGILIRHEAILLLRIEDETGEYWVPPGGGFEPEDVTSKGCLRREYFEEAGIETTIGELICVREFLECETNRYNIELYYHVTNYTGEPHLENLEGLNDESVIQAVEWVPFSELPQCRSYPDDLLYLVDKVRQKDFSHHVGSYIQGPDETMNRLI
ncbi:NUDIX domain-containing protein [Marinomonas gallaica]|uniref:NUDIX domain-containing protein n=1 Tax=Marinomonas gallaica TaxID=1806667 RepID=UPI003A956EC0